MPSPELAALLDQMAATRGQFMKLPVHERRERMELVFPTSCAPGVRQEPVSDLPGALQLVPEAVVDEGAALFYVHGGGFSAGSPQLAVTAASSIARHSGLRVFVPAYRLAPEAPFPAARDDVDEAWSAIASRPDVGRLAVFGESAGGNLALGLMHRLPPEERARVSALVLLSPLLDLGFAASSFAGNADSDVLFTRESFLEIRETYAPGGDYASVDLSPLVGDPAGFPPLLLMCATGELLLDDTLALAAKAAAAQVSVDLILRPSAPHCWPVFAHAFPEALEGLESIASFVRRHLAEEPEAAPTVALRG